MGNSWLIVPIALAATSWLYLLTCLAPSVGEEQSRLTFPGNFEELRDLAKLLQVYYERNWFYVLILFSSAYLYKQTFSIPGSVLMDLCCQSRCKCLPTSGYPPTLQEDILQLSLLCFGNVLAGALFGLYMGFPLCCFLTAIGATCCYLLSQHFGKELLEKYFPDRVKFLQTKIQKNSHQLLYFLLFLRLFPMTPNWLINLASPIVGVPLHLFFLTVFIGLMPYNFLCVQAGEMLANLTSLDHLFSLRTLGQLALMAAVALGPSILLKKPTEV